MHYTARHKMAESTTKMTLWTKGEVKEPNIVYRNVPILFSSDPNAIYSIFQICLPFL